MAPIIVVEVTMSTLLYELKDHVARITFNRPDAANALDLEMGRELMHAAIRASEDPAVRAVILTGAGRMFSGGGDLKSFAAQEDRLPAHLKEVALYLHAAISRFVRMDAPVIAAVNGSAGGARPSPWPFLPHPPSRPTAEISPSGNPGRPGSHRRSDPFPSRP